MPKPKQAGSLLHLYSWVSYHEKGPLGFYKERGDRHIRHEPSQKPRKPRQSRYESDEEFEIRLATYTQDLDEWNLTNKKEGAHMKMPYYREHILPVYVEACKRLEQTYGKAILLEDGDPSHGTRTRRNVCAVFRDENGIVCVPHPAQSPDLNAIEACWAILKQRFRQCTDEWSTIEELKAILCQIWDDIKQSEIQERIRPMPERYAWLAQHPENHLLAH